MAREVSARQTPENPQPPTIPVAKDRFVAFIDANNTWPQANVGIQAILGDALFRNPPHNFTVLLSEQMSDLQLKIAQRSMDQKHKRVGVAYQSERKMEPNVPHVVYASKIRELYTGQRNEALARGLAFLSGEPLVNSAELTEENLKQLTALWHDPTKAEDVAFLQAAYARMAELLKTPEAKALAAFHKDVEISKHKKKVQGDSSPFYIDMSRARQLLDGPAAQVIDRLDKEKQDEMKRDIVIGNIGNVLATVLHHEVTRLMEKRGKVYPLSSIRILARGGMPPMSRRNLALMNF